MSEPSGSLPLLLPTSTLHAGADHGFSFPSTRAPSKLPLATSSGSALRRGERMRRIPFHHQLSDSALGSSLSKTNPSPRLPPRVRVAGRARTLAGLLPSSGSSSKGRGAGLLPLGPRPPWPGVLTALARSRPVSILELGGRGRGRPGREQGCGAERG